MTQFGPPMPSKWPVGLNTQTLHVVLQGLTDLEILAASTETEANVILLGTTKEDSTQRDGRVLLGPAVKMEELRHIQELLYKLICLL